MRDIEFRAWQDDQMLTQPLNNLFGLQRFIGFLNDTAVIEQYIGLKDKNDKKIFEGDRIKRITKTKCCGKIQYEEIQTVKWYQNGFYGFNNDIGGECGFAAFVDEDIEIIGNIHEGEN